MLIAVIVGSTRPGRKGDAVGAWVMEQASQRKDADYELVTLADFNLPLLNEATVPGAAKRQYEIAETLEWSATIDRFDGFVWVTPEYNHGVPAAFKNALDVLYPEWNHKGVGFVAYGADSGVRAVEQWRVITANVRMIAVRAQVSLSTFSEWSEGVFTPLDRRAGELAGVFDQLEQITAALAPVRRAAG